MRTTVTAQILSTQAVERPEIKDSTVQMRTLPQTERGFMLLRAEKLGSFGFWGIQLLSADADSNAHKFPYASSDPKSHSDAESGTHALPPFSWRC